MASRKSTPDRSKITRERPLAYSRRQKGDPTAPPPVDEAVTPAPVADAVARAPVAEAVTRAPAPEAAGPVPVVAGPVPVVAAPAPVVVAPAAPAAATAVDSTTDMPAITAIPHGPATDPARPPGRVPPGDSRSLRRGGEFALVYRLQTAVVSRFGAVGQRGQWRVVEYPTSVAAATAYAKEVSRFVSDGFTDYRD